MLFTIIFIASIGLFTYAVHLSDKDKATPSSTNETIYDGMAADEIDSQTDADEVTTPEPMKDTSPPKPSDKPEQQSANQVSLLVLVNKRNAINPLDYYPSNLVSPDVTKRSGAMIDARAALALKTMFDDAEKQGITLMLSNAFRSYSTQKTLYNNYVARDGQTAADTYSARPGHSEHQTGLAADIIVPSGTCSLEQCFGDLPEGKWLANNSYKYGFIVRYTKTNESEAGYSYEPWHLRYIGIDNARAYHEQNATSLELFLGKPAAPSYL